jgi:secondary thiamine-phosphate synthase enzyme
MLIINKSIEIKTEPGINIYNITQQIQDLIKLTPIKTGQAVIFSRHTTTALAINQDEKILLENMKVFLRTMVPESKEYLHNELDTAEEPMDTHSHLMSIMLGTNEIIPIVEGKLTLGTRQSVLFFDLAGPRERTILCQFYGE